jgi:hypothetical protein
LSPAEFEAANPGLLATLEEILSVYGRTVVHG